MLNIRSAYDVVEREFLVTRFNSEQEDVASWSLQPSSQVLASDFSDAVPTASSWRWQHAMHAITQILGRA